MIQSARRLICVNRIHIVATLAAMAGTSNCDAGAGISTDGSLGARQTIAGANAGAGNFLIPQTLGALVGNNLFHSFSTFNIDTGQSATFTTTPSIDNVISRVTGGSMSQINGQLKLSAVSGAPNFFFINPAGVAFGAGGSIDMPGAFHVSTADYVKFVNGDKFYADLSRTSALSSAAPEAFGFLGTSRAAITVKDGAALATRSLQPISIIGGDVQLNNGTVSTQGGDIRVVALGQKEQEIGLTGTLPMVEGNLAILNGSTISSMTFSFGNAGTVKVSAGAIAIDGQGEGTVVASFTVGNAANGGKTGDAGSLDITASGALSIVDGGEISSNISSLGKAGTVKVNAGSIAIDGQGASTGIFSKSNSNSDNAGRAGDAGSLDITVGGFLSIANGGAISSSTLSSGNAGKIKVIAGSVAIDGQGKWPTGIFSPSNSNSDNAGRAGDAGSLDIAVSGLLFIGNGGAISSSTDTSGNAGKVNVSAGSITIDGQGALTGIFSQSISNSDNAGKTGAAGNLEIMASGGLTVVNTGAISSSTNSAGNAGTVNVSADSIFIDGQGEITGIFSQSLGNAANSGKAGDAGSLNIMVSGGLSIVNDGEISSSTSSLGKAGTVKVNAGSVAIDGQGGITGIFSESIGNAANSGKAGDAGSLNIMVSGGLSIVNDGAVSSSTSSLGKAGSVKVNAGSIDIDGQGAVTGIYSQSLSNSDNAGRAGDAGSLDIAVSGALFIGNGGLISSRTFSSGNAGTVKVIASSIAIDGQGKVTGIFSDAQGNAENVGKTGDAGSLDITASGTLSTISGGQISSNTVSSGDAGTVKVSAGSIAIDGQGWVTGIASQSIGNADNAGKTGNAGSLDITTSGALAVVNGGIISSSTYSSGNAGTVKVNANSVSVDGEFSSINAQASTGSSGQTGSVSVTALDSITLSNQATLSIQNDATLAQPSSLTPTLLTVSAPIIALSGGQISAASTGNVPAGSIQVVSSKLLLENGSSIATSSNLGNGGPIEIAAAALWLNDSQITTSVAGQTGNGGNISIAADVLAMNTGFIQANTAAANASGGLVSVTAQSLISSGSSLRLGGNTPYSFQPNVFGYNVIQAAAPTGISGVIQVSAPSLDAAASLLGLNTGLMKNDQLARHPCDNIGGSSLVPVGRGGLPPGANDFLSPGQFSASFIATTIGKTGHPAKGTAMPLAAYSPCQGTL